MEAVITFGLVGLGILNVVFLLLLLAFARQLGVVLVRLGPSTVRATASGPQIGERVEPFSVVDRFGVTHAVDRTKFESTLLVFVSPACGACRDLAPGLGTFSRDYLDRLRVYVVSTVVASDAADSDASFVGALGGNVPFSRDRALGKTFGIQATPYAVLLGPELDVRVKGIVNNLDQLESLLAVETFDLSRSTSISANEALAGGGG